MSRVSVPDTAAAAVTVDGELGERRRIRLRRHVPVLVGYALLTVVLSWPLAVRMLDWAPGVAQWAFDESTFLWNIWYFKHAAIDTLSNPLHSELIYYPLGIDLVLYTYNVFNALLAQPIHSAVSLLFASNMTVMLSTVLSAYGVYLLVYWLLCRDVHTVSRGGGVRTKVRDRGMAVLAALVAGSLYAFASNRAIYAALGHYDMVTTQWIPFYALTLLQSLDATRTGARRRRSAVLAGVFFAFNGLAEMIMAVFLAIFTLIVLFCHLLARRRHAVSPGPVSDGSSAAALRTHEDTSRSWPATALTILSSTLIIGFVGFVLWSPVLVPILTQFLTDDFSLRGWGEAIPLSTDLLGWFSPTVIHPLFGSDLVEELRRVQLRALEGGGVGGFRDINTVFVGWVTAALALFGGIIYRRRAAVWLWTTLVFGVLTLGPFLQINGRYRFDLDGVETSFPLPYALLHYIPIIRANRAPNRNSVVMMMGVAVLVGLAVYWLLRWISRRTWTGSKARTATDSGRLSLLAGLQAPAALLLAGALLFEHLAIPFPLSDHRVPQIYEQIAADPAPVSVMHAPLGWRNSFGVLGAERTVLQYYQTVHGKPMLGGNISRSPDFKMDYFRRIPLFQAITSIEAGRQPSEELLQAAADQVDELMYLYNVGYVLLMPPIEERYPYADTWQQTWEYYKSVLPLEEVPTWTGRGTEAYRVVQPEGDDSFALDLGEADTYPYRGEGWSEEETSTIYDRSAIWATDEESCLFVPLRDVQSGSQYQMAAEMHPFAYPGSSQQSVTLIVNGDIVSNTRIVDDWQDQVWSVPGGRLHNSINELCLRWGHTAVPREVIRGERQIGTTGVELPIDADLNAFADGAFIALFDEDGNQIDASAGRQGVNVTVLDPDSGDVVDMQGFDTTANEFESAALAQFLSDIPQGYPVLVATRGDAGAFLTEEAVGELRSLGADLELNSVQDSFFALVGVKGAPAGSAEQAVVPEGNAFLRVSLNRDRRTLTAAVGDVRIELLEVQ